MSNRWWAARRNVVRKMVDESKAGVRYVDLHMGGSESIVTGMLPEGILDSVEPSMMLPEVKDPKQWWGGHVWVDNAKRFVYSTLAYQTESLWFNSQLMKAAEIRSFDDLLDERWKGKIGYPRSAHAGLGRIDVVLPYGKSRAKNI